MTRTERLLRLAVLRGDRAAVAIIEGAPWEECPHHAQSDPHRSYGWVCEFGCGAFIADAPNRWTEAELRAAWGDR